MTMAMPTAAIVKVQVQYAVARDADIPTAPLITRWVSAAVQQGKPVRLLPVRAKGQRGKWTPEIVVRIVSEKESAELNQRYRHKNGPTNVLSFAFESPPEVSIPLLGDIVVCAPVAAQEAVAQGKEKEAHWAHLIIHGSLHLLGFDHEEPTAASCMETLETNILAQLGYPDPYCDSP